MLFTSGIRKAVDAYNPSLTACAATADETARLLEERRRRQMIRRHTCSTLKPEMRLSYKEDVILEHHPTTWKEFPTPRPSFCAVPEGDEEPLAPPAPAHYALPPVAPPPQTTVDDWSGGFAVPAASSHHMQPPAHSTFQGGSSNSSNSGQGLSSQIRATSQADDFDDDWSDDDEEEDTMRGQSAAAQQSRSSVARSQSAAADGRSVMSQKGSMQSSGGDAKLKGNINIFSNFSKSNMEAYVLAEANKMSTAPSERVEVVMDGGRPRWKADSSSYTCTIDKPKKETKMKGLKSFIAYTLKSSLSGIQVSRRYKHFDWLQEILSRKYTIIALPPLPEKQVSGRYEEDLIDHRKRVLQLWVDKICSHPVLSKSDVWLHFLTCTEEKTWKNGKRKAEKDEYVGGHFLLCVNTPETPINTIDAERAVEQFSRNVRVMDDASRVLQERLSTYQRLLQGPVKQNWQKLAQGFSALALGFKDDDMGQASAEIKSGLERVAHHYHIIGEEQEAHSKKDVEPVLEQLYSYRGTIQRGPDIASIHKQAIGKWRHTENMMIEGKISESHGLKVKQRVDSMSYVVMAEVNHINQEKVDEYKKLMATYLRAQQKFYQNMANTLGQLATDFEK